MPDSDHAGVIAPPPLLYAVALALVLALDWLQPLAIAAHPLLFGAGVALIVAGLLLNAWGFRSLIRANTPVNPYRSTAGIVDSGAFRFTRNPLYVGFDLVFLGIVLLLDTLWGLVMLVPLLIVMHYGVIQREERYLERRFGEDYRQYRARVRRYL